MQSTGNFQERILSEEIQQIGQLLHSYDDSIGIPAHCARSYLRQLLKFKQDMLSVARERDSKRTLQS